MIDTSLSVIDNLTQTNIKINKKKIYEYYTMEICRDRNGALKQKHDKGLLQ